VAGGLEVCTSEMQQPVRFRPWTCACGSAWQTELYRGGATAGLAASAAVQELRCRVRL